MFLAMVIAAFCALVMGLLWLWRGLFSAATAAVMRLLYAVFELLAYVRLLCPTSCDSRYELLLVWPVLLAVTVAAIRQTLKPPPVYDPADQEDD